MATIRHSASRGHLPEIVGDRVMWLIGMLGGLLWIPYGVFEMLQPWGIHKAYGHEQGYDVVTDSLLYLLYSLPGSLALMLTAVSLLGICRHRALGTGGTVTASRALAVIALLVGGLSLIGVALEFDPLFTGPRLVGTMALALGILLAGWAARRAGSAATSGWVLIAVGLLGVFLFPLWPLVNGLALVPAWFAAAVVALFGLSWVVVGSQRWQG